MEKYLIEEYNVYEDKRWLKNESQIEECFKDCGRDFLECGQGYAQDEAEIICKIKDKFYLVKITAEIGSEWQDRGDRLYFVDYISSVEYEEIDKPKPKSRVKITYNLELTEDQRTALENYMKKLHIEF